MTDLTPEEKQILNFVVTYQLTEDCDVTGRRIRAQFCRLDPSRVTEMLQSMTPTLLTSTTSGSADRYRITLKGLLASEGADQAKSILEEIQSFLRQRLKIDPDFDHYTFGDLLSFSNNLKYIGDLF